MFRNNHLKALGINKTFQIGSVVLCLISLLQDEYLDMRISEQFFYKLSYFTIFMFGWVSFCRLPTVTMSIIK